MKTTGDASRHRAQEERARGSSEGGRAILQGRRRPPWHRDQPGGKRREARAFFPYCQCTTRHQPRACRPLSAWNGESPHRYAQLARGSSSPSPEKEKYATQRSASMSNAFSDSSVFFFASTWKRFPKAYEPKRFRSKPAHRFSELLKLSGNRGEGAGYLPFCSRAKPEPGRPAARMGMISKVTPKLLRSAS